MAHLKAENDLVKKDISVLIDSYDNFKKDSFKTQSEFRERLHAVGEREIANLEEKEKIIDRLNSEIQEEIKAKIELESSIQDQSKKS